MCCRGKVTHRHWIFLRGLFCCSHSFQPAMMYRRRAGWEMTPAPPPLDCHLNSRFWGRGVTHTRVEGIWFPILASWWGLCAVTLVCSVEWGVSASQGHLVQADTSEMYVLTASQGCVGAKLLSWSPFPEGAKWATADQLLCSCLFFEGLPERCCLMQSEAGLCKHRGQAQPWWPSEDGLGPLCNLCSGEGQARRESRTQGNSFPREAPGGTKSQSLWNRARHWWRKKLISLSCGASNTGSVALWDRCKLRHLN